MRPGEGDFIGWNADEMATGWRRHCAHR
jgi:hypothetical protein